MTIDHLWKGARPALTALLAVLVSACAVTGTTSNRTGPETPKLTAVKVDFDPRPPATGTVTTTAQGILAPVIVKSQAPINAQRSRDAVVQFEAVFSDGFRNRFPRLAAAYGLQISPTAPDKLRLRVTEVKTYCTLSCVTRVMLAGDLLNAGGAVVWQFATKPGQATIFAAIDGELFDKAARELLDAMKKDGLIGG